MKTLEYNIQLNQPSEKVWDCLWQIDNYKKWTRPFSEGTYYKTSDFKQGNKIHFLSPDGNGMYSTIEVLIINKLVVFNHIGEIKNFEEQPLDEKTKQWTNAKESYELIETTYGTNLIIKVDCADEYLEYMNTAFLLAIEEMKKLAS